MSILLPICLDIRSTVMKTRNAPAVKPIMLTPSAPKDLTKYNPINSAGETITKSIVFS
jgi:hypothetical protein